MTLTKLRSGLEGAGFEVVLLLMVAEDEVDVVLSDEVPKNLLRAYHAMAPKPIVPSRMRSRRATRGWERGSTFFMIKIKKVEGVGEEKVKEREKKGNSKFPH